MGGVCRQGARFLLPVAVLLFVLGIAGQTAPAQDKVIPGNVGVPEASLPEALGRLAARAGFVFVGTVERVERTGGIVEVTLGVEQVLQGDPGSRYVLREWAGRWPLGVERYTAGQRALFFLPVPGASGLSSPVDGADGVVPVLGAPASGASLDVRRLNTRLERQVGEPLSTAASLPLGQLPQLLADAGAIAQGHRPANPSGEVQVPIMLRGSASAHVTEAAHGTR